MQRKKCESLLNDTASLNQQNQKNTKNATEKLEKDKNLVRDAYKSLQKQYLF